MIKAIVSSKAELDALPDGLGYAPTFSEGDEAIVAGVPLIFLSGKWEDKVEYDARQAELLKERMEELAESRKRV